MSDTSVATGEKSPDKEFNGVNLTDIENLVSAIGQDPNLAQVQFQARSVWRGGTQAECHIGPMMAGGNDIRPETNRYTLIVDEPKVLGGKDEYPNPVEYIAAALCGCITAGIATNAALFGTELTKIEVDVDVNFDIHGVLGLNRDVPSGPLDLHYRVKLAGPGAREAMMKSKSTIDRKSPIRNSIELPLRVTTDVEIEE